MSYQVIARKWRPQTFDEVSGQAHVTTALRNAIRNDRVPHALLLCGPRGVGKTTLARIIARCLNCEKGPTDAPCGTCTACEEISAGRSIDVQEVDAASRTSVDDVRELIEAIRYAPSPGKHKIYVVDEVHMLSTAAFNALLKTLEEPPPRSLFIFATTNPEKIPFTVLSRCQRYDLRRIATAEIVERLVRIAEAEEVKISEASLLAVAREGDGSMRDAQTLLDQLIAFGGGGEIGDETVTEVLDLIDRRVLLAIAGACIDSDPKAALEGCGRALEAGSDPKRLASSLVQLLRDLVVTRIAPEGGLVEGSDAELDELRALAERADEARLRRMFRALIKEQEDLAWAPQPSAVLEMALVRVATLASGDDVARLLARIDALERKLGSAGGGSGAAGGGGASPQRPGSGGGARRAPGSGSRSAPAQATPAPEKTAEAQAPSEESSPTPATPPAQLAVEPAAEAQPEAPRASPEPAPEPAASAPEPAAPTGAPASPDASADTIYDRLCGFAREHERTLVPWLEGSRLVEHRSGSLVLEAENPFRAGRLRGCADAIEAMCERFFGEPTRLEVREPESGVIESTPDGGERDARHRQRNEALNHPAVNVALRVLDAEIVDIKPLGGDNAS